MFQTVDTNINLDKKLDELESEIGSHNRIIEDLIWQRSELLAQKQDLDMYALIDCINEKGLTTREALEMINFVYNIKHKLA